MVLVATGGLSHQVHGERCGFNDTEWDHQFLDLFQNDPEAILNMTHADLAIKGGWESAEVVMWMIARGALSAQLRCVHREYYLPSMTGIAVALYENQSNADTSIARAANARHLEHVRLQTAGAEALTGTYPFTLSLSQQRHRINKYLHQLIDPAFRVRFKEDLETTFEEAGLTEQERNLIRERDWRGLIQYGAIFFLLEKLGAATGVSNLHIYAAMRGQSLEEFQKTRNTKALYSVAGAVNSATTFDKRDDKPKS